MLACVATAMCLAFSAPSPTARVEQLLAIAYDETVPVVCEPLGGNLAGEVIFVRSGDSWRPQRMGLLPWVCDALARMGDYRVDFAAQIVAHEAGHWLLGVSEADAGSFSSAHWQQMAAQATAVPRFEGARP